MIKSFAVSGLFGSRNHEFNFHEDINILTGKNGSGKTALLKLIWYLLSGNIDKSISELKYSYVNLKADTFELMINITRNQPEEIEHIKYKVTDLSSSNNFEDTIVIGEASEEKIEELNSRVIAISASSVFFPTFRRIEGGFSLKRRRLPRIRRGGELEEALTDYSNMMSSNNHKFIASIFTNDVERLLSRRYNAISEKSNTLQEKLLEEITKIIQTQKEGVENAVIALGKIKDSVEQVTEERQNLFNSFSVLHGLIMEIFKGKGIKIDEFSFGESQDKISSFQLSAGEKQMLSFLCYNAFSEKCSIFIDEPEISLHVDWQRILFPTLIKQRSSNQFIVSTHSPFIYSKYPDKELVLDQDRGDR